MTTSMSNPTDRPLYEDLLKQRNDLERLVLQMVSDFENVAPAAGRVYRSEYDKIISENRRREGLT